MFMVLDTVPENFPPISEHEAQDGLNVISAPKIANDKNTVASIGVLACIEKISPTPDDKKPMIAVMVLDLNLNPFSYILSTKKPALRLPNAPKISGIDDKVDAYTKSRSNLVFIYGNNQVRQKKKVKLLAKY